MKRRIFPGNVLSVRYLFRKVGENIPITLSCFMGFRT